MSRKTKLLLVIADIVLLYASLAVTLLIRYPTTEFKGHFNAHLLPFSLIFVLWAIVFYLADLYREKSFAGKRALTNTLFTGTLVAGFLSIALFYLFGDFFALTPKTNLALFVITFFLLDLAFRATVLSAKRKRGVELVILGDSPALGEIAAHAEENPHFGYRIVEWIREPGPDLGRRLDAGRTNARGRVIVVGPHLMQNGPVARELYHLLAREVPLTSFADLYESVFGKVPLDDVGEEWFVEHIATRRPLYDRAKRALDFTLALALAIVTLPLSLVIAILVPLTSPGPAVFVQKRVGKHGEPFTLYKFRTMRTPREGEAWDPWTEENDKRKTSFGKFLRITHLDELPQLWNIVRGDISFTGPRPESIELAERYKALAHYDVRQLVKPGLTGWAQVNYPQSTSVEEAYEKLKYDTYYVKYRSFLLDTLILLRTVRHFFIKSDR